MAEIKKKSANHIFFLVFSYQVSYLIGEKNYHLVKLLSVELKTESWLESHDQ